MRSNHVLLRLAVVAGLAACDATDDPSPDPDGGSGGTAGTASGGKGGSGGTAGTAAAGKGGSGGTAGTGGAGTDGGAGECSPCVREVVRWGNDGGFVAFTETSELSPCNAYRHERSPVRGAGTETLECERNLPCMGSGLHGIADVERALDHADVKAALAKGMVLFGVDSRPVDGQVFRIEVGASIVDVGSPCMGGGTCTAIPAGVSELADLLRAIDSEHLGLEPCRSEFMP